MKRSTKGRKRTMAVLELKERVGIDHVVPVRGLLDTADWSWYRQGSKSDKPDGIAWGTILIAVKSMLLTYPQFTLAIGKGRGPKINGKYLNQHGANRADKLEMFISNGLCNCDLPKSRPVQLVCRTGKGGLTVHSLRTGKGRPISFFIGKSGYPTVVWP